ncbi:DUF6412 domain-containing protein [Rhodococcus sp. IEGM 1370]|uniref:DUF6412 domain-containing protein n=1 Tax=unclassified Rhodococcus (in: high G+C Gram-positive bacteria) TaxID=192944 RepID=UPI0011EF464D|nr:MULTISPECIES: DUF6412 domain-containing protein [unclassified Rhodococcus (in: high G+C Gram-positive bacteria)]KAA0928195.1 hypothetical protein FQ188_03790 [Rhodococcus sp. ANT_H53B]MDV8075565.1 DUF6412 domain-containing protein [Rhodococcus sp. IEGM 1370]
MRYQSMVVTSLLLVALFLTMPTATADVALILVAALATLMLLAHRVDMPALLRLLPNAGPAAEERHLRGSFRRQHRPDAPGRPQPRAPGALVGAL